MLIGFSDGVFNKLFIDDTDRYKYSYLNKYFFNAIELHAVNEEIMNFIINNLDANLYLKFKYISLHAPSFYNNYKKDFILLEKIREICKKFEIKNVVIHPDQINNWDLLEEFSDLPLSIENMDSDKNSFKSIKDFEAVSNYFNLKITLDLNHVYDNDKSMLLAERFQDKFSDKIVEYHISGHDKIKKHVSLYKSKQLEIIKFLRYKQLPIIIESDLNDVALLKKEYMFIKKGLNSSN